MAIGMTSAAASVASALVLVPCVIALVFSSLLIPVLGTLRYVSFLLDFSKGGHRDDEEEEWMTVQAVGASLTLVYGVCAIVMLSSWKETRRYYKTVRERMAFPSGLGALLLKVCAPKY